MRAMTPISVLSVLLLVAGCERDPGEGRSLPEGQGQVAAQPSFAAPSSDATSDVKEAAQHVEPAQVRPLEGDALANHYVACWNFYNERKWDKFEGCYDEKATSRAPDSGQPELKGRHAIIDDGKRAFLASFSDARWAPEVVLVNGREIVSVVLLTGTNDGPLKGADGRALVPTNQRIGQRVLHRVILDAENQITEETLIQDGGNLYAQLGLAGAPGRSAAGAPSAGAPNIVVAKHDALEKINVDLVKKSWEDLQKEDIAALGSILAEDVVEADQAASDDVSGKKAVLDGTKMFLAAMGKIQLDCPIVWGAGPYVVSSCNFEAVNDGNMGKRFKKTGKVVDITVFEVTKLDAGQVKETLRFMDGAAFSRQLGLAKAVPSATIAASAFPPGEPGKAPAAQPATRASGSLPRPSEPVSGTRPGLPERRGTVPGSPSGIPERREPPSRTEVPEQRE